MYQTLLKPLIVDVKTFALDILFPVYCLACEKHGPDFLCAECAKKLSKIHQICIACQKPSPNGLTHPGCLMPQTADGLFSLFDYHDERVSRLIIAGKYYFVKNIYKNFGRLLAENLAEKYPELLKNNFLLTPVPLYWARQNWRGFNQAAVLCQSLSETLKLQEAYALKRSKPTKTQKDLKKPQRKHNVEKVFSLAKGANVKNQNFFLVDDVTTTGSTLAEAARVLKRNGANKVWCLTIAKD